MKLRQAKADLRDIQMRMLDGEVFYSATGKTKFHSKEYILMASETGDEVGMYVGEPIREGMFYELVEDNA